MRFNGLDLNLLVALDALLAEGGITRAAHRVHLTQSAMSGALARLREHFGDALFVQVGRKMVRTPLAEGLEAPVRDILLRIDSALDIRPQFDPAGSRRRFVVAASDYMIAVLLERVLARAYAEAPGVSFALESLDKGVALLEQGEIDLLIIPRQFASTSHPAEVAIRDTYTCAVWEGHTSIGTEITLPQYLEAGHVGTWLGPERTPTFEDWFMKRFGIERRIEVLTYNLTSPIRLVVGTQRIATVHTRLAHQLAASLPVRLVQPPVEFPQFECVMQWHRYKTQDPGLAWLRRIVLEVGLGGGPGAALGATP